MAASWRAFTELTTRGRATPYEKEYFRKDGSRWWGLFAPRLLEEGEAVEFILEISERKLAERRQSYLFKLNEALRDLADPQAMIDTAMATLGAFLEVAQVGYGEIDEAQAHVTVHRDWNDGRIASVVGTWRMDNFGPAFIAGMERGKTIVIPDIREDARICAPEVVASFELISTRSILDVPLVKDGRMVAMLFIHHPEPRAWTPTEVAIVEETGERLWSAIERARAEEQLRVARDHAEQARRAAEDANRTKSHFLAAASHDLRQPVQSLFFLLSALEGRVKPGAEKTLAHATEAVAALKSLLDGLLDISRLDTGAVEPEISDFPISTLLEQIDAEYKPIAEAKGLDWHVTVSNATVRSDPALLGRMLRNLCQNAIRYTEAGSVLLTWGAVGDALRIKVQDTGIGIPPDKVNDIFEEFLQIGNAHRDRSQGLGLGLAIVRRLSKLLGHPVEVSSAPGEGSTFCITVPKTATLASRHVEADVIPIAQGEGELVIVIDDEDLVRHGLKMLIGSWDYTVLDAASGSQALAALQGSQRVPDLIISDYRLPEGRTGIDVIRAIRTHFSTAIPAILLTGETTRESTAEAAAEDISLAHKPISPSQLHAILRTKVSVQGRKQDRAK
ncbi:PAS domain-containing hybrid sensor histidine kinase/response regulator [Azospirillum canadense]|uniref:PAS domain-containing hybrid sensor histidine kinase/response regulator n=1 Tax=Azospirillum canadense TaxID=403962 RepID=UPI0022275C32|nr:ATP-binding protein [Azospirillum canadense]MCW2239601.1 signal transduction histidine kinase/ActR/RegA family two-component response regulator [Azospirillum canadense]